VPRLRRTNPGQPGITRRRRGKGWAYLNSDGSPVTDMSVRRRIDSLVIPPAWRDVWITPFANGHLQAVGTDAAGRRQYLYHPDWHNNRSRQKHQRVLALGAALPRARSVVARDLTAPELTRERLLATAFRLLDAGHFRIGGEIYSETNGSYGLSTLRRDAPIRVTNLVEAGPMMGPNACGCPPESSPNAVDSAVIFGQQLRGPFDNAAGSTPTDRVRADGDVVPRPVRAGAAPVLGGGSRRPTRRVRATLRLTSYGGRSPPANGEPAHPPTAALLACAAVGAAKTRGLVG
jgi:hypothetical protein